MSHHDDSIALELMIENPFDFLLRIGIGARSYFVQKEKLSIHACFSLLDPAPEYRSSHTEQLFLPGTQFSSNYERIQAAFDLDSGA
ncbi:hypothetical protein CCUS01_11463 [Colletotrichum cuscutae]|uniref:Uncharacterized protein n=1 Tax=Colletotrichum cuscutae TaxID=1209917 RepID=A0AAI9XHW7_9PEZI|nr:hypothetical protein CCUS01_11463 [Colletotrichum cuscutae]